MWLAGVFGAPVGHVTQDWQEVATFGGELVVTVALGDDGVVAQHLEALGQDAGVDIGNAPLYLTKALRASAQLADNERGPFATEDVGGGADAGR